MLTSMYYLKDVLEQLTRNINTLKIAIDPDKKTKKDYVFKDYFNRHIAQKYLDLCLINKEFETFRQRDNDLAQLSTILSLTDDKFKEIQDEQQCIDFFEPILNCLQKFKDNRGFSYYGTYEMTYSASSHQNWLDNTNGAVSVLADMIEMPKGRPLRILDPDAKEGSPLEEFMNALKDKNPDSEIEGYAVDTKGWIGWRRDLFKRVILGELIGSTISHNIFDVVYMPTVDVTWEYQYANMSIVKAERDVLKKVTDYLAPGGILIMSLPQGHLYREMCIHLGRYYEDINIFRTPYAPASGKIDCMTIIAHKREEALRAVEPTAYASLRNMPRHWDSIQYLQKLPETDIDYKAKMTVPFYEPDMKKFQFRGSKLDEREFARMFQISPAMQAFNKKQGMTRKKELDKHPATPFSVGQLGLIVTSGVANGLIDEGNGRFHAAKSNIIKHIDSIDDLSDDGRHTEVTERTSNRVEFNVFLADGTAKKLCSA